MYDKIMIDDNRLIATSNSKEQLFIGKKNDYALSMKEITTKNKMEECKKRILNENKNQMKYKNSMKKIERMLIFVMDLLR